MLDPSSEDSERFWSHGPVLQARGIELSYPSSNRHAAHTILHNVSVDLKAGQSVALVGESGSGKTSLMRAVLQLLYPSRGEVLLLGQSLTKLWRKRRGQYSIPRGPTWWRRHLQMVFQNAHGSLDARFSVYESIAEPLVIYGEKSPHVLEERVASLLDEVGLDPGLAHRRANELSGGQRQRVAIARALALGPQVLIADEPTSALDVTTKAQILDLFRRLVAKRNLALLLVSHDLGAVASLCERTLVMRHGAIVEEGSTRVLLGAPKHPYTQKLIEAVPRLSVPKRPIATSARQL